MRQQESELVQTMERELARALREKDSELQAKDREISDLKRCLQSSKKGTTLDTRLTVQCSDKQTAPYGMASGSATNDHGFVYFTPADLKSVYSYQLSIEKWEQLPQCPYRNSGLVVIDGSLTVVGGLDRHWTNKLFTLQRGQWVEKYPPMSTARSHTAVVRSSDGDYIIVIGGLCSVHYWIATVELLHVKSRKWYELADLPQPLTCPSATLCDCRLYVLDSRGHGYLCSLQALSSSDQPSQYKTSYHGHLSLAYQWYAQKLPLSADS